ncbi:MAG: hypothetical protein R3301_03160, partial [Saprospiraceae bacterium]|nr:hypothetical protein [Saprospiraceae bacterium]
MLRIVKMFGTDQATVDIAFEIQNAFGQDVDETARVTAITRARVAAPCCNVRWGKGFLELRRERPLRPLESDL